jgi:hypothetical protein
VADANWDPDGGTVRVTSGGGGGNTPVKPSYELAGVAIIVYVLDFPIENVVLNGLKLALWRR